jgi:DNA-binding HxlR family transcriptional regulator/putative sterol carrier protein
MKPEVAARVVRAKRSYEQWCAVARAMDIVGERWTILIVRDLLVGAKRYTDLLQGLPGIGTNLLAQRLHELEAEGVVERIVLPPPVATTVYRLTPVGEALRPIVHALGRWGFRFLGSPRPGEAFLADPFFLSLHASYRPGAVKRGVWRLNVDGRVFEVRIEDGACTVTQGSLSDPDAVITADAETLFRLRRREITAARAVASGKVTVEGPRQALDRFVAAFAWPKEVLAAQAATSAR